MKRFHRILSAFLCVVLLIPSLATIISAVAPVTSRAVPSAPTELDSLSSYLHASVSVEDNTSHLPVNVHTYYDSEKEYTPNTIGVDGTVSILYVMNTNTERLGNKTDAELVRSFLDRDYFVIVLDYMNNPAATGTALDWSVQDIRCQVIGGSPFAGGKAYTSGTYTDGQLVGEDPICAKSYILPAGYDIAYNIPYFSYDKHGTAGTFELIVEIWNNDFKSVKRNTIVKWVDENGVPRLDRTEAITEKAPQDNSNVNYATWFKTADGRNGISQAALEALPTEQQKQYPYTYIGNTKVVEVTDCVQPDGTMIDLNLYFDILYPSDYDEQLPVMIAMSSNYTRTASWTGETRPYLNGPLFNGYVGVVSDYGLVPMCRNDHYGYFCGDSQLNSVSGDNGTYSLSYYNGIHSDTALLRTLRKIGVDGMDVEGYGYVSAPINPEKIGAYGNSKAGVIVRLANPTPEKLSELRNFEGHMGETRLEALEGNYPYVDPYIENGATTDSRIDMPEIQPVLTYNNGETIHSGLNFVFANCGGASDTLTEGSAPIFGVGTQAGEVQGSYYTYYRETANLARNLDIPFFGLVAPKIAHDLGYGLDKDYGIDILDAFNRYADYWLKDDNAECIIVDVDTTQDICVASDVAIDNIYEITEDSSIKLQFTGPIDEIEIQKVQIVSLSDGKQLSGEWYGSYGDQQWQFIPYDIKDATYYTVVVPDNMYAKNGKPIKQTVTRTFRTANGVTESAVSVTAPDVEIASYDCVNRGFSVAAAGYTLDQSTYKFNAFKGTGIGLQIDLRAIGANSGINGNQNVRFPIFDEIWADSSYVGKTVKFSFEAMASEAGSIKLALNQHGNGDYVWGDGWGLISSDTKITTDWQTYTYEFVVTQEMFDAKNVSTSATPLIALGVRFSGFLNDSGTYKGAQINFRNFKTYAAGDAGDRVLEDEKTPLFFTFADKDYSTANDVTLRFAVENDAVNTVGVYEVSGGKLGNKLGEVVVTGAGIYNFDVTDYVKKASGAPVVAVKIEKTVGNSLLHDYNYEGGSTEGIYFNSISKSVITSEIDNADGSANTSAKLEYAIRSAYYIDLDGNLVSKYTGSLYNFASSDSIKASSFNESDYGRRFRVTFRVYDETSRVVSVSNGDGYDFGTSTADFKGTNYSFYTTAGEWTTVTVEFTVDDEMYYGDTLRKQLLLFGAENKGIAVLDADAAVNRQNMANATSKPGNYAGAPGLNDSYTTYKNVEEALAAGKVTFYEDFSYGLYIDDIVFTEITTSVDLAQTAPMLSITPTTSDDILPTVSASVLSTSPNTAQDGLWISGGRDGFDTKSVKSYVKLSLDGYYGGYAAFLFNAIGQGNANVSVYGVADVASGESWSSDTITSANAPANDIYGAGVNLNAVYGGAPLATFAVGVGQQTCLVELTEFADYMAAKGAKEITLILVSDAKSVTDIEIIGSVGDASSEIAEYDCITTKPDFAAAGYTLDQSTYKFISYTDEGLQVDLRTISTTTTNTNANLRLNVFNEIWKNTSYVGKTIRLSFSAKATKAGAIRLSLNQAGSHVWANASFAGLSETADLTTSWQTFTYEFVVTQAMFDGITNGTISSPGLALGVRFYDFSDDGATYNGAQVTFSNFVVSETGTNIVSYDCVTVKPGTTAAGYTLDQSVYKFYPASAEGIQIDTRAIASNVAPNPNAQISIFDSIWSNSSYVGKTIRFSFSAKATEAGTITLALNKRQKYSFTDYPGFAGTADLTTSWKTFTYEFVVTQDMYNIIDNTANGIDAPGLALGISFTDFSDDGVKYNAAQITFRNFVVSMVEDQEVEDEEIITTNFDFSATKPGMTYSGYSGSNIYSITDGALELYAGKITNGNANQNFRASVFNDVFGNHTENIGKTFRVIFRAKATTPGQLDLSLNSTGGAKDAFNIYPGHSYSFNLTEEYQTFSFSFVALEGMYDRNTYNDIALGIRLFNGFFSGSAYKDATISIDDLTVVEDPYIRSVDVKYDFDTNKPTANFSGYSKQVGSVTNGVFEIRPHESTSCNAGQYARVYALDKIWENSANSGKTFTVSFRAKATVAGAMDFSFNKDGSFNNYAYGGKTYTQQYNLTTEYQTFTYTFTVIDDMFTTNATTQLVAAFRFYNGYRDASTGLYKNVTIQIDEIRVYEELEVKNTTVEITDSQAVSGSGNSDKLNVYADDSATGAPKIYKSYFSYDLSNVMTAYGATLGVNLSGANGETVRVYVLAGVTLPSPLTYANAPIPVGAPVASFTAVNGMNIVDLGNAVAENAGKTIVVLLAIEEPSGEVQITAEPKLNVVKDYHNYTGEAQRHPAIAPTYTTPGNVEFYSCEGCEKLYVKNGDKFVEVDAEDVFLPVLEYNTVLSGASLNLGTDLSIRYHVTLAEGEAIEGFIVRFTLNGETVTVSDYTYDENLGKYVFTFCGIAPQCMGDSIKAELVNNGKIVDTIEKYSVREYVVNTLKSYSDNSELCTLLSDLLVYGAAAQEYVGYKTNALVTEGVDLSAASTAMPNEDDRNRSVTDNDGDIKFTAAGVRFDYVNRIYVKLTAASLDGVTVSVNGEDLEIVETGRANVYIAYSDAISALSFGETVTFTLSVEGEAVQTLTYTVNDYALSKYNDAEIGSLALALYRYGKSAVAYKATL